MKIAEDRNLIWRKTLADRTSENLKRFHQAKFSLSHLARLGAQYPDRSIRPPVCYSQVLT